jgi:trehalose 6-phosphate synthase
MIVVSNRGPVAYERGPGGELEAKRGGGGLVTALGGLASQHEITWIASAMSDADRELVAEGGDAGVEEQLSGDSSCRLRLLTHDPETYRLYYEVIANPVLWFLQHDLWDLIQERDRRLDELEHAWRDGYMRINAAFAEAVIEELSRTPGAIVFFNDYHLYLAPRLIRARVPEARLLHFVHIPWPFPNRWRVLPEEICLSIHDGLLANDVVGFHTDKWRQRFLASSIELAGASRFDEDALHRGEERTRVTARAISIDPAELGEVLESPEVQEHERQICEKRPELMVVRVDRTDPSKNIVRGFQAFALFLERHPELHRRVGMLSCLDPSRLDISEYEDYLEAIESEVKMLNERFAQPDWVPIDLEIEDDFYRSMAAFRQYDVLFVNALYDGLNLVAKEAPMVNRRDGVLILSENTGAHEELGKYALSIDPLDVSGQADAIHEALTMAPDERRRRIDGLRSCIRRHDLSWWINGLLGDLDRATSQVEARDRPEAGRDG